MLDHGNGMTMCRQTYGLSRSIVSAALLHLLQERVCSTADPTVSQAAPVHWQAATCVVQSLDSVHFCRARVLAVQSMASFLCDL